MASIRISGAPAGMPYKQNGGLVLKVGLSATSHSTGVARRFKHSIRLVKAVDRIRMYSKPQTSVQFPEQRCTLSRSTKEHVIAMMVLGMSDRQKDSWQVHTLHAVRNTYGTVRNTIKVQEASGMSARLAHGVGPPAVDARQANLKHMRLHMICTAAVPLPSQKALQI